MVMVYRLGTFKIIQSVFTYNPRLYGYTYTYVIPNGVFQLSEGENIEYFYDEN